MSSPNYSKNELPPRLEDEEKGDKATSAEAEESQPIAAATQHESLDGKKRSNANGLTDGIIGERKNFDYEQKDRNITPTEKERISAPDASIDSMEHVSSEGIVKYMERDVESLSDADRLEEEQLRQALAASNNYVAPGAVPVTPGGRRWVHDSSATLEGEDSVAFQSETHIQPEASFRPILSAKEVDEEEERQRLQEANEQGRRDVWQIYHQRVQRVRRKICMIVAIVAIAGSLALLIVFLIWLFVYIPPIDSYPLFMNGSVWNGSLVERQGDDPNFSSGIYFPCSTSSRSKKQAEGNFYRYNLKGNGMVAAASLCGNDKYVMYVYFSCELSAHCAVDTGLPFAQDCAKYWWETGAGTDYCLLIGTPYGDPIGNYSLMLGTNDHCSNAYEVIADNAPHFISTNLSLEERLNTSCGIVEDKNVWYSVRGTGKTLSFYTCEDAENDSQVSVYSGECDNLRCITAGAMSHGESFCQYKNSASWLSVLDQIYFIRVSSVQEATFAVSLSTM